MKPPRISSLAARLEARGAVANARHDVHGRAAVAVSLLERAHEVRKLDIEILDLERMISKISDTQESKHYQFKFWIFKLDIAVADKKQLEKLVAVLTTRRDALLGSAGAARIKLAEQLAAELMREARKSPDAETDEEEPSPLSPPPLLNGGAPVSRWGA